MMKKELFFVPKRSFPFTYNKKKLLLKPEDEILRKDVKSIEYVRDIMKYKSPIMEINILKGKKFSKKLTKDLFILSKTNDEFNVNSLLNIENEKKVNSNKRILNDNESIKTIDSSTFHYNQLNDYYDKIEKEYNTQTNFFKKKIENFPKLNTQNFKRNSLKNLYEVIKFNHKTSNKNKKNFKEYNNNSFSLSKEKEIIGNKINKIRVNTATTFFNSFSLTHSKNSYNTNKTFFGYKNDITKTGIKYDNNNSIKVDSFLKKKINFFYFLDSPEKDLNNEIKIGITNISKLSKGNGLFRSDENCKSIINNYLNSFPKEKFISNIENNKKVYVILDGTVVLSHKYIKGIFIDIPTNDYLKKLNVKKRFKIFKQILNDCALKFNINNSLEFIYLIDGTYINDLIDIPNNEKCLFVSFTWNFRGIRFYNKKYQEKLLKKIKNEEIEKKIKKKYEFKIIKKKKKYLINQSFTFGLDDIDDKEIYYYYSDSDEKRTKIKLLKNTLKISKYHNFAEYHNKIMNQKIEDLYINQNKKIKKFNSNRVDENSLKGLKKLIKNYNTIRGRENKISVNYMLNPPKTKKINIKRDFDSIKFYGIKKRDKLTQEVFDYKANYEYKADYEVEKNYPDLIAYNIPSILEDYPKLQRRELFDIFIQFKNLLKFCISIRKNLDTIKSGIDFQTFVLCNRKINSQGRRLAKKIFNAFNLIGNGYLNFDEYFIGLMHLRSKDLNQRYEIFLKIIDTDGNQKLSFYEVYDLSTASLKRTIGEDYSKDARDVIRNLGDFFAKLIFQLVDMPLNSEIPISLIKKKILEGGEAASYLEMLICADNFV